MGIMAGYLGGKVETFIMRLVDVLLSFPDLITGMVVLAVIGGGLRNLIIAIAITIIPRFARFSHAPSLALRGAEYVESAIAIGASDARVMRRHIFPNVRAEILVLASLWTATAIRVEANLSFIGLGISPPTPTWGQMIREGMPYLSNAPWHSVLPGLCILVTVLGFNLIGDGLRDALDPRSRAAR
jgi:peptide/nickel transport system permease protein